MGTIMEKANCSFLMDSCSWGISKMAFRTAMGFSVFQVARSSKDFLSICIRNKCKTYLETLLKDSTCRKIPQENAELHSMTELATKELSLISLLCQREDRD